MMSQLSLAYILLFVGASMALSGGRHGQVINGIRMLRKRQHQDYSFMENTCFTLPQLEAFKAQFSDYIDSNDDGKATYPEIKDYLQKYNPDVTEEQVREFLVHRDTDGDGEVDFIPDYMSELITPSYTLSKAKEWFDLEDSNHDGYITKDELMQIALNIGMSQEEAEETAMGYYMGADTNGDGRLDWNEYSRLSME